MIECQRTRRQDIIVVLTWSTPALKAMCIRTTITSPCQHIDQFSSPLPCHALYFLSLSPSTRRIASGQHSKPASPVPVSGCSRDHHLPTRHAVIVSPLAVSNRVSKHCHPRKLFGSAVPALPAQPAAPPAISALQGACCEGQSVFERRQW
jgi:hypothetical protein